MKYGMTALLFLLIATTPAAAAELYLRVYDAVSGAFLNRANLYVINQTSGGNVAYELEMTDSLYIVKNIPADRYLLIVELADYKSEQLKGLKTSGDSVSIRLQPERVRHNLPVIRDAKQFGAIKGRVIDGETKQSLADAAVYLYGTRIGMSTAPGGEYELRNIPAGVYTLIISYLGFEKLSMDSVQVIPDSTITLKHTLALKNIKLRK